MSSEKDKRVRKEPDRFKVWEDGDKHAPTARRIEKSRKKKAQAERNRKCQEKKKQQKRTNKIQPKKGEQNPAEKKDNGK